MYLNRNYIKDILKNAGIEQYNYLFVSNDVKLNKHNGKIYKYILNELNIKPNQMIHIGDSKRADFIFPRVYGINSILIPRNVNHLKYCNCNKLENGENLDYNILQSFINNNMPTEEDTYFKIGYETLGPLLYGYSKWLIDRLKEEKIEKIFFLAREGNLLKKAFDIINKDNIESRYLYVSRRSTRVCKLVEINTLEDVFSIVKMKKNTSLEDFFTNIGLDIKLYTNLYEKYNYKKETNINQIKELKEIFKYIKEDIMKNAKEEEKNLLGYLKQEGFYGKIAISDIGWAGTMQNALDTITNKNSIETDINGFYVGQDKSAQKQFNYNIKANSYIGQFEYIRAFVHLFEEFFLAQHGTTLKYIFKDNRYEAVLGNYEYNDREKEVFYQIQNGAIKFIKDFNKKNISQLVKMKSDITFEALKKLGTNPSLKDVKIFTSITYLDTSKGMLTTDKNIIYYILHPKEMYIDLYRSGWKIGFLKQVFKINISYIKIYNLLKNKEKKN